MTPDNSTRRSIAIGYNPDANVAPRVLAKGLGSVAESILAIARKHDIHIHEDANLARSLYVLELGQEIPEEFYVAVAEVLAYLYKLDRKLARSKNLPV